MNVNSPARRYRNSVTNYDKNPFVRISNSAAQCQEGWFEIIEILQKAISALKSQIHVVVIETYHGVYHDEIIANLKNGIEHACFIDSRDLLYDETELDQIMEPFLGDHPIFGFMSDLNFDTIINRKEQREAVEKIKEVSAGTILIYGPGSSLVVPENDLLIYADMARWEIQQRMRSKKVSNLGTHNHDLAISLKYKRAFFVDWRICDRLKRKLISEWDYVLDTNLEHDPKMVSGQLLRDALSKTVRQPFRVVPFFDPGVWGGQWMKEVCQLDPQKINYAWCFDCVPEENSLVFGFGNRRFEIPSINLVFVLPGLLLGEQVYQQFGAEFPIRFDFLDTMNGGNLSLQVHPDKEYIRNKFGMTYTQDESYYILDAAQDATVFLGLKEDINSDQMLDELDQAQNKNGFFDTEKHVAKWPVKKHDHVLIPAGTIHCSGRNSMVLEISATPYIFTFKLWDWGRLDFDGKPRPISLKHGKQVLDWNRTASFSQRELINQIEEIKHGDGWREERTGLHETEFIETRRHWFRNTVMHHTHGNLNVLNLVEGNEVIVESPEDKFAPFVVHYAETFIVPACIGPYSIRPYGSGKDQECATIKAYVRI